MNGGWGGGGGGGGGMVGLRMPTNLGGKPRTGVIVLSSKHCQAVSDLVHTQLTRGEISGHFSTVARSRHQKMSHKDKEQSEVLAPKIQHNLFYTHNC